MLNWFADKIGLAPTPPPMPDHERAEQQKTSHEAKSAISRADRAIDVWNERIREGWEVMK
jgi:hypothetical protein